MSSALSRDSSSRPLPYPPPLGFPVPTDRHAVSVQLPTWDDMCGMASQEARVISVQQIGYPRSFLNEDVVKVNNACLALLGRQDEKVLVFPALNHALACQAMIIDSSQVRIMAADFLLEQSGATDSGHNDPRRFYMVFYPVSMHASAMTFWRLTGTGISSRLAHSMHNYLDNICPVATGSDEMISEGPKEDSLHRELANTKADELVRRRIVNLLHRASTRINTYSRFMPSDVFLYPTGMTAIYQLTNLLRAWRQEQTIVFGFPYELTLKMMQTYGQECKFYGFGTPRELDEFEDYLESEAENGRRIQSVWCECASNPLLKTVDLAHIRQLADTYGFVLIVDETIGSFANIDLADVADVIITSLTKSFSGRANVMAGSIVLNPALPFYEPLKKSLTTTYANELFGNDAVVLEYNSRKFLPRAAVMNRNAQHLVNILNPIAGTSSSTLTHLYHPSTCAWSQTNYKAFMREATSEFTPGYGGLFTLEFESVLAAATFFDALNVHKGPSLGASVTLAQPYVQTVFAREKSWAASYGLSETIVRISTGLEDHQSLAREFLRALRLADRFKAGREVDGYLHSFL